MSLGGEIMHGHYIGKVGVPLSLLFQNKNIVWYTKLYHAKRDDMKEQLFLVKASCEFTFTGSRRGKHQKKALKKDTQVSVARTKESAIKIVT
eukprot:11197622-Ditylum_brightwellii.AAC.1